MAFTSIRPENLRLESLNEVPENVPFSNHKRAADKLLLCLSVANYNWPSTPISHGGGISAPLAAEEALRHSERDKKHDTDFVRRFFENSGLIETHRIDNQGAHNVWAKPTGALLTLLSSLDVGMEESKNSEFGRFSGVRDRVLRNGTADESGWGKSESFEAVAAPLWERTWGHDDTDYAQDIVRKNLERGAFLASGDYQYRRVLIAQQLRIDLEGRTKQIDNGHKIWNRLTSPSEAKNLYRRVVQSFQTAAEMGYRVGTEFVLTVSPHADMSWEERMDSANDAIGDSFWESLKYQMGRSSRPHRVGVVEFQDNGLPHFHFVVFGVSPSDFPAEWLRKRWTEKEQIGQQISIQEIGYDLRNEMWVFPSKFVPVAEYYTKFTKMMMDIAEGANPEAKTRRGEEHWKLGLLWASNKITRHDRISTGLLRNEVESVTQQNPPSWVIERYAPWIDEPQRTENQLITEKQITSTERCRSRFDDTKQIPTEIKRAVHTTSGVSDSDVHQVPHYIPGDLENRTTPWSMKMNNHLRKQAISESLENKPEEKLLSQILNWIRIIIKGLAYRVLHSG